jgi:hypothetical protein
VPQDTILKKIHHKQKASEVAQCVDPEFRPYYCKKKKKKKKNMKIGGLDQISMNNIY